MKSDRCLRRRVCPPQRSTASLRSPPAGRSPCCCSRALRTKAGSMVCSIASTTSPTKNCTNTSPTKCSRRSMTTCAMHCWRARRSATARTARSASGGGRCGLQCVRLVCEDLAVRQPQRRGVCGASAARLNTARSLSRPRRCAARARGRRVFHRRRISARGRDSSRTPRSERGCRSARSRRSGRRCCTADQLCARAERARPQHRAALSAPVGSDGAHAHVRERFCSAAGRSRRPRAAPARRYRSERARVPLRFPHPVPELHRRVYARARAGRRFPHADRGA